MTRQPLPEQHGFYFNEEQGIPRRSSAQRQGITPQPQQRTRQQNTDEEKALRMPGSQLRHRPIGQHSMGEGTLTRGGDGSLVFTTLSGKQLVIQRGIPQDMYTQAGTRSQTPYQPPDGEDEDVTTTAGEDFSEEPLPKATRRRKRRGVMAHPFLYLGVGMLAMLALWVLGTMLVTFIGHKIDDMTYGYPRTYQVDAVVDHNNDSSANPSHFIFINLNRRVEVIETPAGDPTKMKVYIVATLFNDGDEYTPVTGYFKDVNGDGKPDMIIKIQDSRIVFINTGDGFRPLKQGEQVTLPPN